MRRRLELWHVGMRTSMLRVVQVVWGNGRRSDGGVSKDKEAGGSMSTAEALARAEGWHKTAACKDSNATAACSAVDVVDQRRG